MRIYAFTEHYPNPYKPYYDAQFAQFLDDGHDLRVFAFGKFDATRNAKMLAYGLASRTTYLPSTLRTLGPSAAALPGEVLTRPLASLKAVAASVDRRHPAKRNLLDAARALGLPSQPPDLCLIHSLFTAQYYPFLRRLYPGARIALYFHGGEVPDGGTLCVEDVPQVCARMDAVFTNTAFSRRQIVERGCPPWKVTVNPVGFCLADYLPPERKRYRAGGLLRLLTVGRLSVEKGLDHALDAAALLRARRLTGFRLRVVGDGWQRAALERRIASEGLAPMVELAGELPHHALADEYRAADALLLPSYSTDRWAETQACVVQEAMLMKLAVVASRTGGVPESLAPELHRLSVPEKDPRALAERIAALLEVPEGELRRLGEAGRAFAARRYDVVALNRSLLAKAMAAPGRPAPAIPSIEAADEAAAP